MRWHVLLIGAVLALACGRAPEESSRSTDPASAGGGNGSSLPCNDKVAVRLAGVNAGAQQQLTLSLAGVALQDKNGPLTPTFTRSGGMSLPGDDRLAFIKMPSGEVDVTVRLDHVGLCTTGTCTDLTLCASPIRFSFDAAKVSLARCHVVLQLDVTNSVQSGLGGALVFQPRASVHY
jgi:hypothetical protein